jgi:hypothetical protein
MVDSRCLRQGNSARTALVSDKGRMRGRRSGSTGISLAPLRREDRRIMALMTSDHIAAGARYVNLKCTEATWRTAMNTRADALSGRCHASAYRSRLLCQYSHCAPATRKSCHRQAQRATPTAVRLTVRTVCLALLRAQHGRRRSAAKTRRVTRLAHANAHVSRATGASSGREAEPRRPLKRGRAGSNDNAQPPLGSFAGAIFSMRRSNDSGSDCLNSMVHAACGCFLVKRRSSSSAAFIGKVSRVKFPR